MERLNAALITRFTSMATANGTLPLVVYFPSRVDFSVEDVSSREVALKTLDHAGVPYTDLRSCVAAVGVSEAFVPGRPHYSPTGNAAVAACLLPVVRQAPARAHDLLLTGDTTRHRPFRQGLHRSSNCLRRGGRRWPRLRRRALPQVVSVGALDMVNFGPRDTVPEKFAGRKYHIHNASVTLMRTTPDENAKLGEEIGRKVAAARGSATIILPLQGVPAIDRAGQPFDDPAARSALFDAIRGYRGATELIELDRHINDPAFAEAAAERLLAMLRSRVSA
jgi:hypothetical protein